MNQNRFDLITGVGRGLNASLARRFARGGFAVGLIARRSTFHRRSTAQDRQRRVTACSRHPGRVREFVAHRNVSRFRLRTGNSARRDRCRGGRVIFTGATSSVRGGGWLVLSSAKFAYVAWCNRSRASSGRRVCSSRTWSWTALSARRVSRPSVANRSSIQITCPDVGTGFASAT